jgi:hypothetical protein
LSLHAAIALQQEQEHKRVSSQQQGYHDGRNEIRGTELTRFDADTDTA